MVLSTEKKAELYRLAASQCEFPLAMVIGLPLSLLLKMETPTNMEKPHGTPSKNCKNLS